MTRLQIRVSRPTTVKSIQPDESIMIEKLGISREGKKNFLEKN